MGSQGGARRSPPKGFDLRRKADVLRPSKRRKKQRHSRGEMCSEHNGGASLAAFLLAVSTITLLFVSPVEGQVGENCVVTAFPGEPESCPPLDGQGNPLLCVSGQCQTCESADIAETGDCGIVFGVGDADQRANCQRDCFGYYTCTPNADCPANEPTCDVDICVLECKVSALPGASGSCPDIPVGQLFAGPEFCVQGVVTSVCVECARYEQNVGIGGLALKMTTAADCEKLTEGSGQTADVVANCQRGCFGFYACDTNADCPDTLPFCDIDCELFFPINVICTPGQCVATDPSECIVSALPGEDGSCPDTPQEGFAGPQICS